MGQKETDYLHLIVRNGYEIKLDVSKIGIDVLCNLVGLPEDPDVLEQLFNIYEDFAIRCSSALLESTVFKGVDKGLHGFISNSRENLERIKDAFKNSIAVVILLYELDPSKFEELLNETNEDIGKLKV